MSSSTLLFFCLFFLVFSSIFASTEVHNEASSIDLDVSDRRLRRKRRKGCYQKSKFHKKNPKPVTCSPLNCGDPKYYEALCYSKKVRASQTICKKQGRSGKCKRSVTVYGFVNQCVRQCKPKKNAKGSGDPHLTTFDGFKFDFQGEADKHYKVFGRSHGGDMLITKMRASPFWYHGTKATYFGAFGLTIGDKDTLTVETVPREGDSSKWSIHVVYNGEEIKDEGAVQLENDIGSMSITKEGDEIYEVHVLTKDADYKISGKKLWKVIGHLDVNVGLVRTPSPSFKYDGLLGDSLNHVLGTQDSVINAVTARDDVNFEDSLREKFGVDSLFPAREAEAADEDVIATVARIISDSNIAGHKFVASIENEA